MRVVMRVGITPLTAVISPVMRVMRHAQSKGLNRKPLLCVSGSVVFGVSLAGRGTLKGVHPGTRFGRNPRDNKEVNGSLRREG
jgi:hypothetical protein